MNCNRLVSISAFISNQYCNLDPLCSEWEDKSKLKYLDLVKIIIVAT